MHGTLRVKFPDISPSNCTILVGKIPVLYTTANQSKWSISYFVYYHGSFNIMDYCHKLFQSENVLKCKNRFMIS